MAKGYKRGVRCSQCGGGLGVRNQQGVCSRCRPAQIRRGYQQPAVLDTATEERVLYYAARAELGLDLFAESPYRGQADGHARLWRHQTKLTGAARRIAAADEIE